MGYDISIGISTGYEKLVNGLLIRRSWVRFPVGSPLKTTTYVNS